MCICIEAFKLDPSEADLLAGVTGIACFFSSDMSCWPAIPLQALVIICWPWHQISRRGVHRGSPPSPPLSTDPGTIRGLAKPKGICLPLASALCSRNAFLFGCSWQQHPRLRPEMMANKWQQKCLMCRIPFGRQSPQALVVKHPCLCSWWQDLWPEVLNMIRRLEFGFFVFLIIYLFSLQKLYEALK